MRVVLCTFLFGWIAAPMGAQCYQTLDITFQPHGTAPATLVNPLPHADTKELNIIAVGDSVVWGQRRRS